MDDSFDVASAKLKNCLNHDVTPGEHPLLGLLTGQLDAYFRRELQQFSVPLDIRGTTFQQDVWKMLTEIPYGETRSYLDIAKAIGNPKSGRAVGLANGANRIAIVIPCHRVINTGGGLGGYGGGLDRKRFLLQLEAGRSELQVDSVSSSTRAFSYGPADVSSRQPQRSK
ncbi:MAG: methylated-DNA--[protein]-cysteine S-methyltransferase [Gemmataceae bacterium]|nr:methylated-DNA--[protein]-cysteine S-methyltransferase [Gemmataceae bacterium]